MRRHAVGPSTTVTLAAHSLRPRVGPLTSGRLFARRPACSRPLSWRRRRAVPPVPCHCCGSPVDHQACRRLCRSHPRWSARPQPPAARPPPQPPAAPLLSPPPALSTLSALAMSHVGRSVHLVRPLRPFVWSIACLRPRRHRYASAVHQRLSHQALARHAPRSRFSCHRTVAMPCRAPARLLVPCVLLRAAGVRLAWQVLGSRPAAGTVLLWCSKFFVFVPPWRSPRQIFLRVSSHLGAGSAGRRAIQANPSIPFDSP